MHAEQDQNGRRSERVPRVRDREQDVIDRHPSRRQAEEAREHQPGGDEQRHGRRREQQQHRDEHHVRRHDIAGADREPDRAGDQRIQRDQHPRQDEVQPVAGEIGSGEGRGDAQKQSRRDGLDQDLASARALLARLPGILQQAFDRVGRPGVIELAVLHRDARFGVRWRRVIEERQRLGAVPRSRYRFA